MQTEIWLLLFSFPRILSNASEIFQCLEQESHYDLNFPKVTTNSLFYVIGEFFELRIDFRRSSALISQHQRLPHHGISKASPHLVPRRPPRITSCNVVYFLYVMPHAVVITYILPINCIEHSSNLKAFHLTMTEQPFMVQCL